MKKLIFLAALAVAALGMPTKSAAQVITVQDDQTIVVVSEEGVNVMDVKPETNDYKIRIAGWEITIGESPEHCENRRHPDWFDHATPFFEIGMSSLHNVDYSLYGAGAGNFMDLNIAKSIEVNLSPFTATIPLTHNRRLALLASFQFVWHNYVFENKVRLVRDGDGVLQPTVIDDTYRKSKITTFSMRVPLMLDVRLTRHLFISAGVWGGATTTAYTKIKYPIDKDYKIPVNVFQYGFLARVGYGSFYLYADYAMTPLFRAERGPVANTLNIGIGLGF